MRNLGQARVSTAIGRHPAVNIHHATRIAAKLGTPLNWMVTINFDEASIASRDASLSLQKLIAQRFAPWLRRTASNDNHAPPTYVWALEAPGRTVSAHWLVHIPAGMDRAFQTRMVKWLEGLSGGSMWPRALHFQPITDLINARRYVLKGVNPIWASHLGVRPKPQGAIQGKRSGFSKNLGPTARKRAGYRPMPHRF